LKVIFHNGIALPEMPSDSPGMPGFKIEKWKIHSVKNAKIKEYLWKFNF
jgi:hypothetical protein